jgi:hypothetical protein
MAKTNCEFMPLMPNWPLMCRLLIQEAVAQGLLDGEEAPEGGGVIPSGDEGGDGNEGETGAEREEAG